MKNKLTNLLIGLLIVVGASVLLYPTVSDWWNRQVQTRAIIDYESNMADMDADTKARRWAEAEAYNAALYQHPSSFGEADSGPAGYENILSLTSGGIMGYLVVNAIDVKLPVYHGTSKAVLAQGVGHLQGSSLPVGGINTHAVLSAHTGLPSSKLFSDLNELKEGDRFELHVLDKVLTYEVNQIKVVLPNETNDLRIESGKDYCTLFTCTPYGINSHRLLVRGERVAVTQETLFPYSQATRIDPLLLWPIAAGLLAAVVVGGWWWRRKQRRDGQ